MIKEHLDILGIGVDLPQAVDVREYASAHGADISRYSGWNRACHGGPDDHPSTMSGRALLRALEQSSVSAAELKLVIYCGTSRDYPPSWSVSTEIMRLCGVTDRAMGMDMMAGCLATLAALDFARGWLAAHEGGYAAVIAAERWTQTVDFTDASAMGLWAYGDGAGALVVGLGVHQRPRLHFAGAEFRNVSKNNGHVLVPYGGTRAPQAPPGASPNTRQLSGRPRSEISESYRRGYADAFDALKERFDVQPTHLVLNQLTPKLVAMVGAALGLEDKVTITGHATGHMGGPDIITGLNAFLDSGADDQTILVGASAAYVFGTGFVIVPPDRTTAGQRGLLYDKSFI